MVELYVHVVSEDLSNKIYDIEILPEAQQPPWENAEGLMAPEGWAHEKLGNGVRFYTKTRPLIKCKEVIYEFRVQGTISEKIRLHITDTNHENLGMVISTRKSSTE